MRRWTPSGLGPSGWSMSLSTHRLYPDSFDETYATTFTADVLGVDGAEVVLNQTVVHPTGGGQPCDVGHLVGPTGSLDVSDVRGRDAVHHRLPEDPTCRLEIPLQEPSIGTDVTPTCACIPRNTFSVALPTNCSTGSNGWKPNWSTTFSSGSASSHPDGG